MQFEEKATVYSLTCLYNAFVYNVSYIVLLPSCETDFIIFSLEKINRNSIIPLDKLVEFCFKLLTI